MSNTMLLYNKHLRHEAQQKNVTLTNQHSFIVKSGRDINKSLANTFETYEQ